MIPAVLKYPISLKIPYTKLGIRIPIALNRNIPESWNELKGKQIEAIMPFIYPAKFGKAFTQEESKLLVTRIIFNIPWLLFFAVTSVQKIQLGWLIDFIYQEKNDLTKNLLPFFRLRSGQKLYGPGNSFDNLIGSEFVIADQHFFNYFNSGSIADLDKFIACLYRPKRKNYDPTSPDFKGDIREDFNSFLIAARSKKIAKISLAKKLVIYTYYIGCRSEWEEIYPLVFPKETGQQSINYGWLEALYKAAGEKFGTLEQTEKQPMENILMNMQIQIKDHKEFEKKHKPNNTSHD